MKKLDFKLPNYDLVFGYDKVFGKDENQEKSIIFEKRGTNAKLTDYATILSCMYDGDENTKDKIGTYWLDNAVKSDKYCDSLTISQIGGYIYSPINKRIIGIRPIINYSSIKDLCFNTKTSNDGVIETYFGSYPHNVSDEKVRQELNERYDYNLGFGIMTNKDYTFDKTNTYHDHKGFSSESLIEYKYNDKKYVRVPVNSYLSHSKDGVVLSDGNYYNNGTYVWIEVTPQKMLVDEENDIAIFEDIILAGIQFNKKRNYKGNLDKTFIKKYLDKYFANEILPNDMLPNVRYIDNDIKHKLISKIK